MIYFVPEKLANLVEIKNYNVNYGDHNVIMVDLKKDTSLPEPCFQFIAWKKSKNIHYSESFIISAWHESGEFL